MGQPRIPIRFEFWNGQPAVSGIVTAAGRFRETRRNFRGRFRAPKNVSRIARDRRQWSDRPPPKGVFQVGSFLGTAVWSLTASLRPSSRVMVPMKRRLCQARETDSKRRSIDAYWPRPSGLRSIAPFNPNCRGSRAILSVNCRMSWGIADDPVPCSFGAAIRIDRSSAKKGPGECA